MDTTINTDINKPAAKKPKSIFKRILNIASYAAIALILVFVVIFMSMAITSRRSTDVPVLFGTSVLTVESESMTGVINKGDLITIKRVTSAEAAALSVGDIITYRFYDEKLLENALNTHEIIEIHKSDGFVVFQTKGVHNASQDPYRVASEDVIGVYSYGAERDFAVQGRIKGVGAFISFLRSLTGFFLLVIFPLTVFLGYRVFVLVKVIKGAKKEKALESAPSAPDDYDRLLKEIEELRSKLDEKAPSAAPDNQISDQTPANQASANKQFCA